MCELPEAIQLLIIGFAGIGVGCSAICLFHMIFKRYGGVA